MLIYHYDPLTKEFSEQSEAMLSPLEDGVFLIPAFATTIKPTQKSGYAAVFNESTKQWELIKDLRGHKLYHKISKKMIICDELNFDDSEYTSLAPSEFSLWNGSKWVDNEDAKQKAAKREQIKELEIEINANKQAQDNASYAGNTEILSELQSEYLELFERLLNLKKELGDED